MNRRTTSLRDRIILVLSRGPNYGLAIIDQVKMNGPWWQRFVPSPFFHSLLRDLEREGILTSYEKNDAPALKGGRSRRYYAIRTPDAPTSTIS